MANVAVTINAGYIVDNTQKKIIISGTLTIGPAAGVYPAGGPPLDSVLLALPEATTNSGVRRCIMTSRSGRGYLYQRVATTNLNGTVQVLQIPPNGSLTTASPVQQIPSNTNMQGIAADVIDFEAEFLRNA